MLIGMKYFGWQLSVSWLPAISHYEWYSWEAHTHLHNLIQEIVQEVVNYCFRETSVI